MRLHWPLDRSELHGSDAHDTTETGSYRECCTLLSRGPRNGARLARPDRLVRDPLTPRSNNRFCFLTPPFTGQRVRPFVRTALSIKTARPFAFSLCRHRTPCSSTAGRAFAPRHIVVSHIFLIDSSVWARSNAQARFPAMWSARTRPATRASIAPLPAAVALHVMMIFCTLHHQLMRD